MTIQEIAREKVLVDIISERDAMILNLSQEIKDLKDKIKTENNND
jgi:hypothetical protein